MEKILPFGILAASGVVRIILSTTNFTPILSAMNYGGASIKNKYLAIISIFLLHFVTDLIINLIMGYNSFGWYMPINYLIDQINGQISRFIVEKENQFLNIAFCSILTSCNFWFLSNLGVFFTNSQYTQDVFIKTFRDAIPFFKNNFFSMIIFTVIIYGSHNLIIIISHKRSQMKEELENKSPLILDNII